MSKTIGERIKLRREELGLSQDELAKKLGYKTRSSITKIEKQANGLPQNKIAAIAKALNTSPAYIMGWEASPEETSKKINPAVDFILLHDGDVMAVVEVMSSLSPKSREELKQFAEFLKGKDELKKESKND